jgi:transposase|tara:strand:- start:7568 stop:7756 length:189 start_codon:yes stop_codon:yes gene_type:complete
MAHARRKFFDLHATNQSTLAQTELEQIGKLYDFAGSLRSGQRAANVMSLIQSAKLGQADTLL